jgi:Protein of unknown function (DUF3237)
MSKMRSLPGLAAAAILAATGASAGTSGPAAPAPTLEYAFTVRAELAPPLEQGTVDTGRKRFIAITGGTVHGPMLDGSVLPGGGDWQTILPGGLTRVEAHYFLKADDGTVIEPTTSAPPQASVWHKAGTSGCAATPSWRAGCAVPIMSRSTFTSCAERRACLPVGPSLLL